MIYKFNKSHTMFNALNHLLSDNCMNLTYDELDIKVFHVYAESVITLSTEFER